MKIKRIDKIEEYKSFSIFDWSDFCKDKNGDIQNLTSFNVVFGENGSGKSSVCDILQSLSGNKEFEKMSPKLVKITLDKNHTEESVEFDGGKWLDNKLDKNSILFFNLDFINDNVHTNGNRENSLQKGGHTQHAGQLIIDLDAESNLLKCHKENILRYQTNFINNYKIIIENNFNKLDIALFKQLGSIKRQRVGGLMKKNEQRVESLKKDILSLKLLLSGYSNIVNIKNLEPLDVKLNLSLKTAYEEISSRKIKDNADISVSEEIKKHFEDNKVLIEFANKYIPENYQEEKCPLCTQPLMNVSNVIDFYKKTFDKTYEQEKNKFINDIDNFKKEIDTVKTDVLVLERRVREFFNDIEKLEKEFNLSSIYNIDEKNRHLQKLENFIKIPPELDVMFKTIDGLKSMDKSSVDINLSYNAILLFVNDVNSYIKNFNDIVEVKNKIIEKFKNNYSDRNKIEKKIEKNEQNLARINSLVDFLKFKKHEDIKNQFNILHRKDEINDKLNKAEKEIEEYLAKKIPEDIISKMQLILERFKLDFSIEHATHSINTKDYAFSFIVKDRDDKVREMKSGLSEGERQLISISFFLAVNDNVQDKKNKIVIFDDPITSLDSANLKVLADLIYEKSKEFSQSIIFTHHSLFFKYLSKYQESGVEPPTKFGILKNKKDFGGSFVFFDSEFNLNEEIRNCNINLQDLARNGNLNIENVSLKYGQLLRLGIERFIKNDLLMWNKDKNFEQTIIENLKESKCKIIKLEESDFDSITKIYKYCNHSNLLHIDKEIPSSLSELIIHINIFISIIDKINIQTIN